MHQKHPPAKYIFLYFEMTTLLDSPEVMVNLPASADGVRSKKILKKNITKMILFII
jgi:hypothetical protein